MKIKPTHRYENITQFSQLFHRECNTVKKNTQQNFQLRFDIRILFDTNSTWLIHQVKHQQKHYNSQLLYKTIFFLLFFILQNLKTKKNFPQFSRYLYYNKTPEARIYLYIYFIVYAFVISQRYTIFIPQHWTTWYLSF